MVRPVLTKVQVSMNGCGTIHLLIIFVHVMGFVTVFQFWFLQRFIFNFTVL